MLRRGADAQNQRAFTKFRSLGRMRRFLSPWPPGFLGQLWLGGDHRVAPADWAEPPALSSYPQTPSYAAECWPKLSRRNSTWPSPAAAEGKLKRPTVKRSHSLARGHVARSTQKLQIWLMSFLDADVDCVWLHKRC